jgi:hypothetical protein
VTLDRDLAAKATPRALDHVQWGPGPPPRPHPRPPRRRHWHRRRKWDCVWRHGRRHCGWRYW